MKNLPFNLSKIARRDPSAVFDVTNPLLKNPYREDKGKPGSGAGSDLVRPGSIGFSNSTPGGGAAFSDNKEWPSDNANLITDNEGRDIHDSPPGMDGGHGDTNYDDAENGTGSSGSDIGFARSNQVAREIDDNNRDRPPFNVNNANGILKGVRRRLRSL